MSPYRFHILTALTGRDLHGAGIVRDVLDQTGGEVRLWPATLYGTLDELAVEGLIGELGDAERPEGTSGRRRYYRITPEGRRVLAAQVARLDGLVRTARQRLGEA